jgi:hypothetical protein
MKTPRIFIAYAPRGIGLRCAVAYLWAVREVYGWFTGHREDASLCSAFFLLENFYSEQETRYVAVDPADLYSGWTQDEARRHELAQLHDAFAHEWLFCREDPAAAAELEAYAKGELAIGEVNIRYARLGRFSKLQPNWTYHSPGFERAVLNCLMKRWPLDYRDD